MAQTADEIRAEIARVSEEWDAKIALLEGAREETVSAMKDYTDKINGTKRGKRSALRKLYLALGKAEAGA
jgi:hypothetical protein